MTEEKQTTLSKLYALRAGLSLLSQEKDIIKQIDDVAGQEIENNYRQAIRKISVFENAYNKKAQEFDNAELALIHANVAVSRMEDSEFNETIMRAYNEDDLDETPIYSIEDLRSDDLPQRLNKAKYNDLNDFKRRIPSKSRIIGLGVGIGIGLLLFVIGLILSFSGLAGAGTPCGGIGIILCIISCILFFKNLPRYRTQSKMYKARVEYWDKGLGYLFEGRGKFLKRFDEIGDKLLNELEPYLDKYKEDYKIFQEQFSLFLDERDWGYVDLIIYYFETGRALTMREALQLVDKEQQTQAIIDSVNVAAREVCRTLQRGFTEIRKVVESGFAEVNGRLENIQLMQEEQLIETRATNALLAKIEASSRELASDVDYMKHYM